MKRALLFLALIVLSSCSTFEWKIPSIQKSQLDASTSVVILSTWAPGKSISSASEIGIRRKSGGPVVGAPIDNYALKSHFQDGWGFLNAFHLPAGNYVIFLNATNPFMTYSESNSPYEFTIKGGEIIYLGEANFHQENGHGVVRMLDRSDRDLPMFIARNPSFSLSDFTKAIPTR